MGAKGHVEEKKEVKKFTMDDYNGLVENMKHTVRIYFKYCWYMLDTDFSGKLDFDETKAALAKLRKMIAVEGDDKEIFDEADVNNDGAIDRKEAYDAIMPHVLKALEKLKPE